LPTIILVSVISITAALIFYTVAVWWNFRTKRLEMKHMVLFGLGMLTDVTATSMMAASVEGKVTYDLHTISGYTALVLMAAITLTGGFAMVRDHQGLRANFHRFSVPVWFVWVGSWITGVILGLQKF
jgi:uncharacterized repeat protein (TIGR03987 family)